jgi:dUTPase
MLAGMFPNIYGNTKYSHHTYIITAGGTINEDYKETVDFVLFNYTNNKLVIPYE